MKNTISILGCGWLGMPLAITLSAKNWQVKGSTTQAGKLPLLAQKGIEPHLVNLSEYNLSPANPFLNSEILFVNIPPGLRKQNGAEAFTRQMEHLAGAVSSSAVKQVIFISSTSVYADSNKTITQTGATNPLSPLYQAETLFVQNKSFKTVVLRFAGLIGPNRHPARFFSGKTQIPNGLAPVNLIHLDDCIGLITRCLELQITEGIYHAAAASHPTKSDFYSHAAQAAGLEAPRFIDELKEWKIIDPKKITDALNYKFVYPDLMECVGLASF